MKENINSYTFNPRKIKALEQFQQTIELLENSNFYYIVTTNMAGNYSYVNSHYTREFSFVSEEFVGMPYWVTMHKDDTKICQEVAEKCFANPERMYPATIRKHDGKGEYIITQWEYKAMLDDEGNPEGIFCLGHDITQYMNEQQQLRQAETVIEKKSFILKEIAFQHAHLIRSPLSNILGLISILDNMDLDVDENIKNICKMIAESTHKLDNIITEVVGKSSKNAFY